MVYPQSHFTPVSVAVQAERVLATWSGRQLLWSGHPPLDLQEAKALLEELEN